MSRARTLLLTLLALGALLPAAAAAQDRSTRVFNGYEAAAGEYPWTVALLLADRANGYDAQFCGGTLVAADVVVTAAHCVWDSKPEELEVGVGILDLSSTTPAQRHPVASIALHPLENVETDEDVRYDAAVLKLATPVSDWAARAIDVVGESASPVGAGQALTVTGWGLIGHPDVYADRMNVGDIETVSDAQCGLTWDYFSADDMFCAYRVIAGPKAIDACNGDSGGPIVTRTGTPTSNAGVTLVGAVSWGSTSCEDATTPGVYTRLAAPVINRWLQKALDGDPANGPFAKPEALGGKPAVSGTLTAGQTISCVKGTFSFEDHGNPSTLELVLRRYDGADPVALGSASHTLTAGDVGRQFDCVATGRVTDAGGFVRDQSAISAPVAAAPAGGGGGETPTGGGEEPPAGGGQVPTGGGGGTPAATPTATPTATPAPTPRTGPTATTAARDTVRPTVAKVARRCTKARRCTFTITARDSGSGVAKVRVTIKVGKRSRTLTAKLRKGAWVVTTPKLARGRHTVWVAVTDTAGNAARATSRTFRLR